MTKKIIENPSFHPWKLDVLEEALIFTFALGLILITFMARILAIDYGHKKIGLAVTDPLQLIVNPHDTVPTGYIFDYLKLYFEKEEVEKVVIGEPLHADGSKSGNHDQVMLFADKLRKRFPAIEIDFQDEYCSSKRAKEVIVQSVKSRKKRRDKTLVDKISAAIILQTYLNHI